MSTTLRRTALFDRHVDAGAQIVEFAGWEMPVQYEGVAAEHRAVRESAGVFDVSHMGEVAFFGPRAAEMVQRLVTNDVGKLRDRTAMYSVACKPDGGIVDDLIVYRQGDEHYLIVVNAGNIDKDVAWFQEHTKSISPNLNNESDQTALLAVQGPKAIGVVASLTGAPIAELAAFAMTEADLAGKKTWVARTGYTGEDGFELYFGGEHAVKIWNALTASGEVTPTGLGARDSLRLEMGMALYGNDLDDTTTPLEASLGWLVKMKKGDFVGRDALAKQKERGLERKLVGFTTVERSFPRHGYPVFAAGRPSGEVRSGTMSPTLGIPIGTAYVPPASAAEGAALEIEIRGKRIQATVQKMPFYKNGSRL